MWPYEGLTGVLLHDTIPGFVALSPAGSFPDVAQSSARFYSVPNIFDQPGRSHTLPNSTFSGTAQAIESSPQREAEKRSAEKLRKAFESLGTVLDPKENQLPRAEMLKAATRKIRYVFVYAFTEPC